MAQQIVKCEVLWTRICPVKCSYCAMADGRKNTQPLSFWKDGVDNLKKLGASFIAFCGAECLSDFTNLPETVGYAESQGIHTTVITSGTSSHFENKLKTLHAHGAKSLTMSYDMIALDSHSAAKSSRAMRGLDFFKRLGDIRDVAIIATLTRTNFRELPETIKRMSDVGIWTFFDFIHADRNQPGCKVKTTDLGLMFQPEDFNELDDTLAQVLELKNQGFLCHSSKHYLGMVSANDHDVVKNYNWHCAKEKNFPAWVTADCDGRVYCCDDYQDRHGVKDFYLDCLSAEFEEFSSYWKEKSLIECPGCFWNHHIDAHQVKYGNLPITDYVHGVK